MGRRRQRHLHLPPLMHERDGRYYYGRNDVALGDDFTAALHRYADLHGVSEEAHTFSQIAALYLKRGTKHLAPKTLREYARQLPRLVRWIGGRPLSSVTPHMVRRWLTERGDTVAATREKALLSAVYSFARAAGYYDGLNPCTGIRGKAAHRGRYVTDDELRAVLDKSDATLAGFLELAYLTGQRPSDVLKMTRADVRDGSLWVAQGKTGAKVRISVVGALDALLSRLLARHEGVVESLYLIRDERGQRLTLSGMRKRFWTAREKAGADWQIRDLRAKAASDADTARHAQMLLGHSARTTTDRYIRQAAGEVVQPILRETRKIAGERKRK